MRCVVTGCAGFVGSNLVDFFLNKGWEVLGIDNLKTGRLEFIENANQDKKFEFINLDLLENINLKEIFLKSNYVFHFAANADVRYGVDNTYVDFRQNAEVTLNVLNAIKEAKVPNIVFSSTGSIYGESDVIPTSEDSPFPVQTSMYGASKLSAEGFITAFSKAFGIKSFIFRFVSILGNRYSHGHVYDFINKIKLNPDLIEVLGDGNQTKSYLNIIDCINGIYHAINHKSSLVNIYNLGTKEVCTVNESLGWICEELNVFPKKKYTGGSSGWIGDNPYIFLDTTKIEKIGWKPYYNIKQSVKETAKYLLKNDWLMQKRLKF